MFVTYQQRLILQAYHEQRCQSEQCPELKLSQEQYEITKNSLIIKNIPKDRAFTLETATRLGENTDLFGLYETEGTVLVKAETEGLRRVLYCHDRPDNLATY